MNWTTQLNEARNTLESGEGRSLVASRLLLLVLSKDDRVAVDAAKLLLDQQLLGMTTRINNLGTADPVLLRKIRQDAREHIQRKLLVDGSQTD